MFKKEDFVNNGIGTLPVFITTLSCVYGYKNGAA